MATDGDGVEQGGDAACWADRVCPACGLLDERPESGGPCPRCGADPATWEPPGS
jgi:hypothetical protein